MIILSAFIFVLAAISSLMIVGWNTCQNVLCKNASDKMSLKIDPTKKCPSFPHPHPHTLSQSRTKQRSKGWEETDYTESPLNANTSDYPWC